MRWSWDRLVLMMLISILVKRHLFIETSLITNQPSLLTHLYVVPYFYFFSKSDADVLAQTVHPTCCSSRIAACVSSITSTSLTVNARVRTNYCNLWRSQTSICMPSSEDFYQSSSTQEPTRKSRTQRSLQWRHNGRDSVSNHLPRGSSLNRLFRRRSKKTSKLRVTGLCAGNSPLTGEFPAQMASDAENVYLHATK